MKPNEPLARLLRSAARIQRSLPAEAPANVEYRVLAAWRRGDTARGDWMEVLPLFRRGLAFACIVLVLAIAWSYHGMTSSDAEVTSLIDASAAYNYYP